MKIASCKSGVAWDERIHLEKNLWANWSYASVLIECISKKRFTLERKVDSVKTPVVFGWKHPRTGSFKKSEIHQVGKHTYASRKVTYHQNSKLLDIILPDKIWSTKCMSGSVGMDAYASSGYGTQIPVGCIWMIGGLSSWWDQSWWDSTPQPGYPG